MYKYKLAGFSPHESEVKKISKPEEVDEFLKKYSVTWLDCVDISEDEIEEVGKIFNFHKLTLEDCIDTTQRPKVDNYKDYFFLIIKVIDYKRSIKSHQLAMFVGNNYLVTVREKSHDFLQPVFNKIQEESPRILENSSDYLCYVIIDTVVDDYFPVLDKIEDRIEIIEEEIIKDVSKETLQKIFKLKKDLLLLRKIIWPCREMLMYLEKEDLPNVNEKTIIYLRDVYDHIIRVTDMVETYRELTSGALDTYLSTVSNNMNEVMKVLTVVASLVLVPALIAGIYGMNFRYMPELQWQYGYPFTLGLMLFVMIAMTIYFRKKRWI